MIPTAIRHRNKACSGFDEPPGQEHALARGIAAIFISELVRFLLDVESGAGLVRAHHGVSALIEGIHAGECVGLFERAEVLIDDGANVTASGEALFVHATGQVQVADFEAAIGGGGPAAKGGGGGAGKTGAGGNVRVARDGNTKKAKSYKGEI